MFNAPIDPFIREHTAEVTVASLEVTNAAWQQGKNGYLTSGPNVEINVTINNPAGIELAFTAACFINGAEKPANHPGGRFEYKKTSNYKVEIKISGITSTPGERIDIKLGIQTADGLRSFSPYNCPPIVTNPALLEEVAATGGITYPTLSAALDAAAAGTESNPAAVKLLKNTDFPETGMAAYTISAKHIKLTSDGGPHTITHRSGHIGSLFEVTGGSLVLENITIRGNGSDGTSAIKVSSKLTMGDNAVVKDFHSLTTGGAVYIAGGTFNMEGGSITGNTAALGGGVFVNGTFVMSGAARIAGNDVYLVMGTYITTGALSGSGVVAVITPQVYAGSPQVLSNGVQRNRFSVTPDGISYYYINSSGVLVPATGGIGPGEILYGTDNADVITISSYIDGTIDAGDGDDTITVGGMNPSSIINAGNGNNTITISAVTSGTITAGDGNDSITINDWFQNGTITAGPGADTINIRYFSGGTIIDVGADTVMDTVIIREDSNSILEMRNFDPAHDKLKLKTGWSAALVGGTVEVTVAGSGKIRLTGVTNTSYGSYIELYP